LRILLDHGFDAGGRLPTWDERSPLHEAAKRTRGDLTELLIERGADPNAVDRMGRTPLYEAVVLGRERIARVLLENGADPNRAPEGEFILDIAHTESLRVMLEEYGARGAPSAKN
jgi:ankyrin repeat protein